MRDTYNEMLRKRFLNKIIYTCLSLCVIIFVYSIVMGVI